MDNKATEKGAKIDASVYLQERIGKNSGKPYRVLIIRLANGYEKMVFLEQAEQFLIDSLTSNRTTARVQ